MAAIFTQAHETTRREMNEYARRQGFTYAETFRSVLRGLYAVRHGYTGEF
jgi:hypothetical protein